MRPLYWAPPLRGMLTRQGPTTERSRPLRSTGYLATHKPPIVAVKGYLALRRGLFWSYPRLLFINAGVRQ